MFPQDYHIHTRFSCDSEASMTEMCRAAMEVGIPEIGFSEHFDLHPKDSGRGFLNPEAYWESIRQCRQEFKGLLTIKAGIEISEPHRYPQEVESLLASYPWDYAHGALHWVGDDLIFQEDYFTRSKEQAYSDYFRAMRAMIENGSFDILAHMDIIKRYGFEHYGPFAPQEHEESIRDVLRMIAAKGMAIEVNTITLRRSIQELSPSRTILDWFHELGGQWVTLGSDAHAPEKIGYRFQDALAAVQFAGFKHLASFEGRMPRAIQLMDRGS